MNNHEHSKCSILAKSCLNRGLLRANYLVAVGAVHNGLGVREHGGAGQSVGIRKKHAQSKQMLTSGSNQGT